MSRELTVRDLTPEDLPYVMSTIWRSDFISRPYKYALQIHADLGLLIGTALVSVDDPRVILAFSTVPAFRYARRSVRELHTVKEYLKLAEPNTIGSSGAINKAIELLYEEYRMLKETKSEQR